MNIQEALHQLLDGKDLSGDDMVIVMEQIMTGAVSNSMIVGFLVACLLYTSPSPRDQRGSRMPSSA